MLTHRRSTDDDPQFQKLATTPSPSRKTPNLIVIGAMKASTTTFYELITRHPNIWFSSEKEPHYFTSPNYGRPTDWEAYLRLFDSAPVSAKVIGEASTGYSKLPHFGNTPLRLQECLDNPRFIYLVRDPVQRTVSNYQHAYISGHYPAGTTLAGAIRRDPILIDASHYARQIRAYHEVFDEQALLVIPADQMHADPTCVMRRVETFLNVPAFNSWETTLRKSNSKQALSGSLALQAIVPKSLLTLLRNVLSPRVRQRLKNLAQSTPPLPPVTDADRQLVFELVANDLQDLLTIMGNELSPWIASWPSIQRLGER